MFSFVDCHCDTITTCMKLNKSMIKNDIHLDFERLKKYNSPIQVFAVWLEKDYIKNAYENTINAIDFFNLEIKKYSVNVGNVFNYNNILNNIRNNKISAVLAIEGGESLEGNIENLYKFYNYGVRMITLTWNNKNELGYGAKLNVNKGLTEFGKNVVIQMNKLGMIVDVSHLNERGFWDVFEISNKPFIASHSNVYNLCNTKRNLTDEQIKAIYEKNGIIGINFYPWFLSDDGKADINTVVKHIDYILNMIGDDNIGLGTDFDGIDITPSKLENVLCLSSLYDVLIKLYGNNVTEKIMYGNFLKLFKQILK